MAVEQIAIKKQKPYRLGREAALDAQLTIACGKIGITTIYRANGCF